MSDTLQWNENVPETPPHRRRQPTTPLQHSNKNHSNINNDQAKYPPPLPISPQVLKASSLKPMNQSSPSLGNLSMSPFESDEIAIQLKKIGDAQGSLKSTVSLINSAVKQTQLDLESLVNRSSNNNTHLKDLLQTVAKAAKGSIGVSEDAVLRMVTEVVAPLKEKLAAGVGIEMILKELQDKMNQLEESIKQGNTATTDQIVEKLDLLNINQVLSTIGSHAQEQLGLRELLQDTHKKSLDSNESLCSKLKEIKDNFDFKTIDENHNALLTKIEQSSTAHLSNLDEQLSLLKKEFRTIFESQFSSAEGTLALLNTITMKLDSQQELFGQSDMKTTLLKEFTTTKNLITENHKGPIDAFKALETKLVSTIAELQSKILDKESFEQLSQRLAGTFEKHKNEVSEGIINQELKNKDLTIELKDKEIKELKAKIEEQNQQLRSSESLIELTKKQAKIEMKLELLNETYDKRYNEFKELAQEHQLLNDRISQASKEKLKSIYGSTSFLSGISHSDSTKQENFNTGRVMSTNSYLAKDGNVHPIKAKKHYPLPEVEAEENSDIEAL